ncbi:uncharacterized protein [Temnothorax nylanderi]|uniref:uncharacterized protein isoform X1 n=1 Tax=Temnothorax nylanderi TaxID=102681 RepID=UPI003A872618
MPISLRGTQLRKHIATKCILLNLQNDEVADLADYMEHAENIHREYYRQPIVSRDILRMSQLLEKAQEDINANGEEESDSDKENEIEENENSGEENTVGNTKSSDLNYNRTERIESYRMKSLDLHKNTPEHTDTSHESINSTKRKRSTSPYGKTKRRHWDKDEEDIMMKLFGKYLYLPNLPPTQDLLAAIRTYKCLQKRTAPQMRSFLHNKRRKIQKKKQNSLRTDVLSSYEDSNDEEDSQQSLIMKHINSIFKQDIETKHIPSVDECTRAQKKSKLLSNLSIKQIQTAVFNLIKVTRPTCFTPRRPMTLFGV